jgi:hypothetical protein
MGLFDVAVSVKSSPIASSSCDSENLCDDNLFEYLEPDSMDYSS